MSDFSLILIYFFEEFLEQTALAVDEIDWVSKKKNIYPDYSAFIYQITYLLNIKPKLFLSNNSIYIRVSTYSVVMILFALVTVSKAGVQRIPFIIRSKVTKRA